MKYLSDYVHVLCYLYAQRDYARDSEELRDIEKRITQIEQEMKEKYGEESN